MRIALVGTTAGCVLGFRADMIKALVAQGHVVYAYALDYDASTRARVEALGAHPADYALSRSGLNPFADLVATFRLSRLLRLQGPDLVFSYFSKPVIFATFAAALAGVRRRIGMLEGLGFVFTDPPGGAGIKLKLIRRAQVLLYRLAFPLLERVIFLNLDDPVDLVETYSLSVRRISVLGAIGLDLDEYRYASPLVGEPTFIFVARLLAEKGVREFVAAARIVKHRHPEARFVMLGAIDEQNPGALTAAELKSLVDERLVLHPGHVGNVAEWLAAASVFVLPSYYREGVPRSTQEAMAIGRAVITTDVPGCRETVVDGVNGFLVPPWNAQALAEKMRYFIDQPQAVREMGLASRRMAEERFDAKVANARLLTYISDAESP
ncbi:glycosyltransferase family 4 protein [Rhodocyclus tenuis]|uniref:Glycosyltransferase involved in cell wall biosynthesis n=1 Tax=Rhodocyclus tenuis TaxID=1066 RepID=A0A840GCJ1_RHOTE|nr:glycosyltransferase family 4 protein [Rhodocyclus tenuis]MBB4246302.1 glycosyltransferase involved in cell wall biosynthesis [Rhodocyclus tenuis]